MKSLGILALVLVLPVAAMAATYSGSQVGAEKDQVRGDYSDGAVGGEGDQWKENKGDGLLQEADGAPDETYVEDVSVDTKSVGGVQQRQPAGQQSESGGGEMLRMQDRTHVDSATGTGGQVRTRTMLQTQEELPEYVKQTQERVRAEHQQSDKAAGEIRRVRERAEIAERVLMSSAELLGDETQAAKMTALTDQLMERGDQAISAEVRTRERSALLRLLVGGDDDAADTLDELAQENKATAQEMEQLVASCGTCDEATRETLREQIQAVRDEQDRIEQVAIEERERKGLLGALFGWIG